MIAVWFFDMVEGFVKWIASLLDWSGALPEDFMGGFMDMAKFSTSMGVWVPIGAVFSALLVSVGVWGACLAIKASRGALSHIPWFGGSG